MFASAYMGRKRRGRSPFQRSCYAGKKIAAKSKKSWCNRVKAFEESVFDLIEGHPSRNEDGRWEFRKSAFATAVVAVCCKLFYPTVDWRTISFGSTKAVCGTSSSGLVASTSTRRAAASPIRWIDWSTDVSGTLKYSA
jgi:hypothetical protein